MKSINQAVVVSTGQLQNTGSTQASGELNEFARQNINNVFQRLQAIFPAWRSAYPNDTALAEAKKIWVMAFIDAGICSTEQVAAGMRKARLSGTDFFPSVGKFISWCRPQPEDFGLPSLADAYREAANHAGRPSRHRWSHPAVYEAGRRTGWFELRNGGDPNRPQVIEKAFERNYQAVCSELIAGAEFGQPKPDSTRLEHHTSGKKIMTEEAKAAGRAALAELKRSVGIAVDEQQPESE